MTSEAVQLIEFYAKSASAQRHPGDERLREERAQKHELLSTMFRMADRHGKPHFVIRAWIAQYEDLILSSWVPVISALDEVEGQISYDDLAAILRERKPHAGPIHAWTVMGFYSNWCVANGYDYRLWIGCLHYFATGEGMQYRVLAFGAYSEAEFLLAVAERIGHYYTIGVHVFDHVPAKNNAFDYLVSPSVKKMLKAEIAGLRGSINIDLQSHANYS